MVDLPKPPSDDSEKISLKESTIKFIVKTGKTPLSSNFKTFVQTTRLNYHNGQYEALPQTKVKKAELLNLGLHNERNVEESASFLVLGGNKSSSDYLNLSQQMIVYSLLSGAKIDIGEIIFNDLVNMLTKKPRKKATPSVMSKLNFHQNSFEVPPIELTEFMLNVVRHQVLVSPTPSLERDIPIPQDTKGNIQPAVTGPRNSPPKDGTRKSALLPEGKNTDPQDSEGNKQPTDMGLLFTSDECIRISQLLLEGNRPDDRDSKGNIDLADARSPATNPDEGIHKS
ncbi:hypothetical protein Tco_0800087 [Tanacetum coccineum]|uniref:Uncharacterized protein n=1 Tax=Tanacetum coccineum TaxID=301880 RepID=A0ABQ4ZS50_9ASTR